MKILDASLFREVKLFSALTDAEIRSIINAPENGSNEYTSKSTVFREGYPGNYMYIVLDGFVELFVKGELGTRDSCIATIQEGQYFGENVALTQKPVNYAATAITAVPCTLFKIHKKHVVTLVGDGRDAFPPDKVRDMILKLPIFKGLNREEIRTVKEWAPLVDFKAGSHIYEPGSAADGMYIVQQGRIELYAKDESGTPVIKANEGPGEYFGEEALLPGGEDKHNHYAKVTADARLIKIPMNVFKSLLERDPKLIDNIKMVQNLRMLKMKNPRK
ncbi:MAG: cyclic nucleotide-binding domain-containing protein [Gammaproteobacteria bacterium]